MVVRLLEIKKHHEVCEGCIYEKMYWLPFPKIAWRVKFPLELVHALEFLLLTTSGIFFSLLMISQELFEFIFLKRNLKSSPSFYTLKHLLKNKVVEF